jgi:hypothetical protein
LLDYIIKRLTSQGIRASSMFHVVGAFEKDESMDTPGTSKEETIKV